MPWAAVTCQELVKDEFIAPVGGLRPLSKHIPREGVQTTGARHADPMPRRVARDFLTLTSEDGAPLDAVLYQRTDVVPTVALVFMHPIRNFLTLNALAPLAERGYATLGLNSRYMNREPVAIMEEILLDMAAGLVCLRERGFEHIVLVGNSGGGSLILLYQAQAENPTIRTTPGGMPIDLVHAAMPMADAVITNGAHRGRAQALTVRLDPAVTNEADPVPTDATLDMFDPRNGPPYSAAFVEDYRAAQLARNRRITAWVMDRLAALPAARIVDQGFVVHRTSADPRMLDLTLDPSDRLLGTDYGPDVRAGNYLPAALARFSTLQSWLSQWSVDHSVAQAEPSAAKISVPQLFMHGTADQAVYNSDIQAIYDAAAAVDKEMHWIKGGVHLFNNEPTLQDFVYETMETWLTKRGMSARR